MIWDILAEERVNWGRGRGGGGGVGPREEISGFQIFRSWHL